MALTDGKELWILPPEKRHHLLDAARAPDGDLGALLELQQVVQGRDGVEDDRLGRRAEQLDEQDDPARLEEGEAALVEAAAVEQGGGAELLALEAERLVS